MVNFSVELQDFNNSNNTEKNCLLNMTLLLSSSTPESSLESELSRILPAISSNSAFLQELLSQPDLHSSESLKHLLCSTKLLASSTILNLKILNEFFSSHKSHKSTIISKYFNSLKALQNLILFEEIYSKLKKFSEIKQDSLLHPDLEKDRISLESQIKEIKSFEYLQEKDYPDFLTVFLSVFSSFIHVTNFYILTLTAKDFSLYVGMDEGFSGVLSAANWASAVVFTFVYSYWSNYQYKLPTFVCALFVVLGDLVYVLAYPLKSPYLLLAGRLLIGVGGARVINRRYIATYVKPHARTAWNSAYVAGSIIGRGLGPFISSWLLSVDFYISSIHINPFTSAPLLMALVWLLYAFAVLIYFKEPEIQKKRENKEKNEKRDNFTPLFVVLFALIVPKMVHEAFVTSVPIVAEKWFGWSDEVVGWYIAGMSLGIAPVHILIAYSSKRIEDRQFIWVALTFTLLGSLLLIDFGIESEVQYIIGTVLMFIGMNMDDGVTASLLSKVLPPHIAEGIFNAGLIVTFAGSSARGLGGLSIAVSSWFDPSGFEMENHLFIPLSIISLLCLFTFHHFYSLLKVSIS